MTNYNDLSVVSKVIVAKLMRKNGLRSIHKKKFKATTNSKHNYAISLNHLSRKFYSKRLNETWVSDITYTKTNQGWLYLTTIVDLFDRQVIGWSLSTTLFIKDTIILAWKMVLSKRSITSPLIFYSMFVIGMFCKFIG